MCRILEDLSDGSYEDIHELCLQRNNDGAGGLFILGEDPKVSVLSLVLKRKKTEAENFHTCIQRNTELQYYVYTHTHTHKIMCVCVRDQIYSLKPYTLH